MVEMLVKLFTGGSLSDGDVKTLMKGDFTQSKVLDLKDKFIEKLPESLKTKFSRVEEILSKVPQSVASKLPSSEDFSVGDLIDLATSNEDNDLFSAFSNDTLAELRSVIE